MAPAPMKNPTAIRSWFPLWTNRPNSSGPMMPPVAVPIAKNSEMASARVSIGNTSLTVRYAELAPAEARKNVARTSAMKDQVVRLSVSSRTPSTATRAADPRYVPEIIGIRPTVSNSRPSVSGPRKLLIAKMAMKYGTDSDPTSKNWWRMVPRSNVTAL
jgi:hypothetical protein